MNVTSNHSNIVLPTPSDFTLNMHTHHSVKRKVYTLAVVHKSCSLWL